MSKVRKMWKSTKSAVKSHEDELNVQAKLEHRLGFIQFTFFLFL
jgi:hypothetical protein